MIRRASLVALGATVLLVAGCATVAQAESSDPVPMPEQISADTPTIPADSIGCIVLNEQGEQRWTGAPGGQLLLLTEELQVIAYAHQDQVTGVALCNDYSGATMYVSGLEPEVTAKITAIGERYPDLVLKITEVVLPLSTQLDLMGDVLADFERADAIFSLGPDIYSGGLAVGLRDDCWDEHEEIRASLERHVEHAIGIRIPLRITKGGMPGDLTLDSATDANGAVRGAIAGP